MAKGFGSQKSPDFTQRQKAYFKLIKQLLNCPGKEMKILRKHPHLLDAGLVETIDMVAQIRGNQGDIRSADFLNYLANWLVEELGLYRDEPSATDNFIRPPAFLGKILSVIAQNKGNQQAVYSLLQANLDQLNENFYEQFNYWINFNLINNDSITEQVILVGLGIVDFCIMLWAFPFGNRAINLEISITGLEAATKIFTREIVPEIWANIQTNLAPAYRNRIRGNRVHNQEKAIVACNNAQIIYTREAFPEEWARVQNNLGLVYTDRITGDTTENIEKSISCYETALKVINRAQLSELWGTLQNNLGNAYLCRIHGDKAQNLEKAIACYQNALSIRTREDFPELWAQTQFNMGSAYRQRIRGDAAENVEMAIAANQAALQVYTKADFPINWAEVHINLANAYLHRIHGDRNENLQKAIAAHKSVLKVLTKEESPWKWALTNLNLGNVFLEQEQIEAAITCYRSGLKIFTPTAFPADCLKAGQMLGNTAFRIGDWVEAIRGYSVAIEAVETSRTWASSESRLDNPLESALILADGRITLGQLLTSGWRTPQLEDVFLSCCETGLGTTEITDDVLTLSTGFLCAGARTVISTIWSVDDLATALFSLFYYQHRHQGNKRLESIKKAQFELRSLTGETLTTDYKPRLSSFLTQKLTESEMLRKTTKKERDIHPQDSQMYQQRDQEYKKYAKIGNRIYKAKKNLESFCLESKPFFHPFYWAAFTCSGLG